LYSPSYLALSSWAICFIGYDGGKSDSGYGCCLVLRVQIDLRRTVLTQGETGGCIARLLMHNAPGSFGLFMAQIFCLVLSPVFFAGVNYVLFSKLARNRPGKNSRMFRWTSYAFIASDILTFLIQATGGSFFSSQNYNVDMIGGKILLAGLVLQAVSVICFCAWMAFVDYLFSKEAYRMEDDYREEWSRIRIARWISMVGITVCPLGNLNDLLFCIDPCNISDCRVRGRRARIFARARSVYKSIGSNV